MEKTPMTLKGKDALEKELKQKISVERPAASKAIEIASEHGDLSENAEYHAAKEAQGWNEARVAELEDMISRAEVIDVQVRDEDFVELVQRKPTRQIVRNGAFAHVEDEVFAIAQLHENGGVHLSWADHRRRPHEDDSHLVWPDLLRSREPLGSTHHVRRRIDSLEELALFPATKWHAAGHYALDILGRRGSEIGIHGGESFRGERSRSD